MDAAHPCPTCRALAETVETQAEHIRQLQHELYGQSWEPPAWAPVTPVQRAMLSALLARDRIVSPDTLIDASRGLPRTWGSHPSRKMVEVTICKLRSILRRYGLEILTVRERGYWLPPETREALMRSEPPAQRDAA